MQDIEGGLNRWLNSPIGNLAAFLAVAIIRLATFYLNRHKAARHKHHGHKHSPPTRP